MNKLAYVPYSLHQHEKGSDAEILDRLDQLLLGNKDAVRFIQDLACIAHVWDDLVDGDVAVPPLAATKAFTAAIVGFNTNPFFLQHRESLMPVMVTGILNWHGANASSRPASFAPVA